MATVKIVSGDGNVGTIDNIPIIPGSKTLGFNEDNRGGGTNPVVAAADRVQQSFQTPICPAGGTGITWALAMAILRTLDNATLSAGTTNGDSDFTADGPISIETGSDDVAIATVTVGG